ncbi:hypothetical protein FN3523_0559 [Francisella hispaniensis]|uniref:Uncharacterized protein n=1 Tax=Francisella hispaniensis TaxID=622488 RepID=F4BJS2_9GAMM|nr:hypothetical protein FN3523_0559 [Francisella hispaniensis]
MPNDNNNELSNTFFMKSPNKAIYRNSSTQKLNIITDKFRHEMKILDIKKAT